MTTDPYTDVSETYTYTQTHSECLLPVSQGAEEYAKQMSHCLLLKITWGHRGRSEVRNHMLRRDVPGQRSTTGHATSRGMQ